MLRWHGNRTITKGELIFEFIISVFFTAACVGIVLAELFGKDKSIIFAIIPFLWLLYISWFGFSVDKEKFHQQLKREREMANKIANSAK